MAFQEGQQHKQRPRRKVPGVTGVGSCGYGATSWGQNVGSLVQILCVLQEEAGARKRQECRVGGQRTWK